MNKRVYALLVALCIALGCLAGCNSTPAQTPTVEGGASTDATDGGAQGGIDYAASVTLDMDSDTLKQEVSVKAYIDGDTTHFHVPTSVVETGLLKARYLAVNTPESTGKIEVWGKKASNFTKEKLQSATSSSSSPIITPGMSTPPARATWFGFGISRRVRILTGI